MQRKGTELQTRTKRRKSAIEPGVKHIKMSDDASVNKNSLCLNSCIATDTNKECFSELDLLLISVKVLPNGKDIKKPRI